MQASDIFGNMGLIDLLRLGGFIDLILNYFLSLWLPCPSYILVSSVRAWGGWKHIEFELRKLIRTYLVDNSLVYGSIAFQLLL